MNDRYEAWRTNGAVKDGYDLTPGTVAEREAYRAFCHGWEDLLTGRGDFRRRGYPKSHQRRAYMVGRMLATADVKRAARQP
jgi:hypothetical protein